MNADARTLTVSIRREPDEVYDFVSNPENLPRWAPAFCKSVRREGGSWIVESPDGPVAIRFVERNPFRVADHHVEVGDAKFHVPMRVLANGDDGSEVLITLFRPSSMSDETFRRDLEMVTRDFDSLRRALEN